MTELHLIQAGPHSSIQDSGRVGYQGLGIPVGGAVDRLAMMLGNWLVGNEAGTAGLEIFLGGMRFTTDGPLVIALTGTHQTALEITDKKGTRSLPAGQAIKISAEAEIYLPPLRDSHCAFLSLQGGIDVPLLYGSASTSPAAHIGGLEGRLLRDGDRLAVAGKQADCPVAQMALPEAGLFHLPSRVRLILGPHEGWFTPASLRHLAESDWQITPAISRMGMRLAQPAPTPPSKNTEKQAEAAPLLVHKFGADLISEGSALGAIQVPRDGQPIIMLADHGTTGGYTKIAHVISADLDGVARLRPGKSLGFDLITLEEGETAARQAAHGLSQWHKEITASYQG
ncbi:MAG: biotin-dependent carboxyltransferase family protein [Candidatus Puniceispirillaceae bacterium]